MTYRSLLAAAAALVALVLGSSTPADAAAEPDESSLVITSTETGQYPQVNVRVTAPTLLDGQTLPADAFTLRESGVRRDVEVSRVSGDELEVVLLLDTSGSMVSGPLRAAQDAASRFASQLPAGTRVAVLGFGSTPRVVTDFTTDTGRVVSAIRSLKAEGETALYDALARSVAQFSGRKGVQRTLVVLSDGADTASRSTLRQARRSLRQGDVRFFGVRLTSSDGNGAALGKVSRDVDGQVVTTSDLDVLTSLYDDIAAQLRSQYELSYRSHGTGLTPIEVSLRAGTTAATASDVLSLPELAPPSPATAAEPPSVRIAAVDRSRYPEVAVTVVAPRALAADELDAKTFSLAEGGLPADVSVSRVPGSHLEVVLAMDVSGSMEGEPLEGAKQAAIEFIRARPAGTQVAVVPFADQPRTITPFTDDTSVLTRAVSRLEASGETALYDATVAAAKLFAEREPATRSVIVLSDGGDTVSESTPLTAAAELAQVQAAVQAVSFQTPETERQALVDLSTRTGGSVTPVEDVTALAAIYDGLATDLGNQYLIRYRSSGHGETDVAVTVEKGEVKAEAFRQIVLPPMPWTEAILEGRTALLVGAATSYLAMVITILLILAPAPLRSTLLAPVGARGGRGRPAALSELGDWAKERVERTLRRRGWSQGLNERLEAAGLLLRPSEFVLLAAAAASVLLTIGTLSANLLVGVALALLVLPLSRVLLSLLARRRRTAFAGQLGDTLQILAGSLRAGYGLLQAVDAVAREADAPTSEEFRRVVLEARLGRELSGTLRAMSARMDSEDFEWVVQAIEIHQDVGGDLAEVLDEVAKTIREREQVFRQVKALSAEGRLSAAILLALPFVVIGGITLLNPSYMNEMFTTSVGIMLLAVGVVLMTVGALWLRKLVKPMF